MTTKKPLPNLLSVCAFNSTAYKPRYFSIFPCISDGPGTQHSHVDTTGACWWRERGCSERFCFPKKRKTVEINVASSPSLFLSVLNAELMGKAAVSSCNRRRKVRRIRYINPDISDPENQGQLFLVSEKNKLLSFKWL